MRVVILPGMGCSPVQTCNWYSWLQDELHKKGIECVLRDFPEPNRCRRSVWIPFVHENMRLDKDTILVGHSTGACCAMRLLENMAANGRPLLGCVLVAVAHTDLGDPHERASEYFDAPWNWENMKAGAQKIHILHSADDPLIPVAEARHVAKMLQSDHVVYHELRDLSHFFRPCRVLLDIFDRGGF